MVRNSLTEAVIVAAVLAVILYLVLRKNLDSTLIETDGSNNKRLLSWAAIIGVPLLVAFFVYSKGPFVLKPTVDVAYVPVR